MLQSPTEFMPHNGSLQTHNTYTCCVALVTTAIIGYCVCVTVASQERVLYVKQSLWPVSSAKLAYQYSTLVLPYSNQLKWSTQVRTCEITVRYHPLTQVLTVYLLKLYWKRNMLYLIEQWMLSSSISTGKNACDDIYMCDHVIHTSVIM